MMIKLLSAMLIGICAGSVFADVLAVSINTSESPASLEKLISAAFPQPAGDLRTTGYHPTCTGICLSPADLLCMCLPARNTGASTVHNTTPVAGRCCLCGTTGTTENMCRAITTATTNMVRNMTRVVVMAKVTAMARDMIRATTATATATKDAITDLN